MIENNTIELYKTRIEEYTQEIKNLNHHLEELESEKKYPKSQYETEKNKINEYIQQILSQKMKAELTINAYESVKENQQRLLNLQKIVPRDKQEEKELLEEISLIQKELDRNMLVLPEELKEQLVENQISVEKEKEINNKTIEDYRRYLEENKSEVQHLLTEIEDLKSMENSLPKQEFLKELNNLKKYLNRERGKLLRNRQVITSYEIVENNQERIDYLNTIIARDEQDKRQIAEEQEYLTNEITQNKRFLPRTLQKTLAEQASVEQHTTSQTTVLNNNNYHSQPFTKETGEKAVEEMLKRVQSQQNQNTYQNTTTNDSIKFNSGPFSKEDLEEARRNPQVYQNRNINLITPTIEQNNFSLPDSEYFDEEMTPEELNEFEKELENKAEQKKGRVISTRPNVINLPDNSANNSKISSEKFDQTIQKINTLAGSKTSSSMPSPKDNHAQSSSKFSSIINSLNNGKYSTNSDQELSSKKTTSAETDSNEKDSKNGTIIIEPSQSEEKRENSSLNQSENMDQNENTDIEDEEIENLNIENSIPRIEGEVVGARKPKKNIRKKLIYRITAVAVALVLLASGVHSYKKNVSRKDDGITFEGEIRSENGIHILSDANPENELVVVPDGNQNITEEVQNLTEETQNMTEEIQNVTETPDIEIFTEPDYEENISSNTEYEELTDIDSPTEQQEVEGIEIIEEIPEQSPTANEENIIEVDPYEDYQTEYIDDQNNEYGIEGEDYILIPEENTQEYNNSDNIKIGSEIFVNGAIHDDEYDAYYQNNSKNPHYGTEPKRVVIGVGIVNDNGMNTIYAYDPSANQKIDQLINEGGELVSILTANKDKYLTNYDGSNALIPDEVKAYAEGWYNINDVITQNRKGVSR